MKSVDVFFLVRRQQHGFRVHVAYGKAGNCHEMPSDINLDDSSPPRSASISSVVTLLVA